LHIVWWMHNNNIHLSTTFLRKRSRFIFTKKHWIY
jgi:hypothetical protein